MDPIVDPNSSVLSETIRTKQAEPDGKCPKNGLIVINQHTAGKGGSYSKTGCHRFEPVDFARLHDLLVSLLVSISFRNKNNI